MRALFRIFISLRHTLIRIIPSVLGILVLNFFLLQLLPGDAADVLAAESGSATAESLAAARSRLGIDQPLIEQLLAYLHNITHFNLGYSAKYNMPVSELILSRLPSTMLLLLSALAFALVIGIIMGWIMAATANRWPDQLLSVVALILYSMPSFWIGLMTIVLFAVKLGWLPSSGNFTIGTDLHGFAFVADRLKHLLLPATAMATFFIAVYARLTRAAMLEVLRQDYMRTAEAKGLGPVVRQYRHALRNALVPVTTVAGIHLGNLLGGAVVIETVYGWPGMGRLAIDAVLGRDYNVLLGILLLSSILVILINAMIDLLHAWLDPRIVVR